MYTPLNDESWSDSVLALAEQCTPGSQDRVYFGTEDNAHKFYLQKSKDGATVVVNSATKEERNLTSCPDIVDLEGVAEEWDPDGDSIVFHTHVQHQQV